MKKERGCEISQQNMWKELAGKCQFVEPTGFLRREFILSGLIFKKKEKKGEMLGSTKISHLDNIFFKKFFGQQKFSGLTFEAIYGKRKDQKEEIV